MSAYEILLFELLGTELQAISFWQALIVVLLSRKHFIPVQAIPIYSIPVEQSSDS